MNLSKLKKMTIPLSELDKDITPEERRFIENEKKYYYIVTALKKKRKILGITQERLSKLSNIPRTTITKVESGSRNVTIQTLMSMAEAMGKRVELKLL